MIRIVTKCNKENLILSVDAFFDARITSGKDFGDMDLEAIGVIDKAKVIDKRIGSVLTPFGLTDLRHLSTGCKAVLIYLYFKRGGEYSNRVLNVTECGANALEVLFGFAECLNDSDTVFMLRHYNNLRIVKDRDYCVNGHAVRSLREGIGIYG